MFETVLLLMVFLAESHVTEWLVQGIIEWGFGVECSSPELADDLVGFFAVETVGVADVDEFL